MTRIALLGSTGSIGDSTLKVVRSFPGQFKVAVLGANSNIKLLYKQAKEFKPRIICVRDKAAGLELKRRVSSSIKIYCGEDAYSISQIYNAVDKVVLAISGSGALMPLINAVERGRDVVLANKEALVMAGSLIMKKSAVSGSRILPVDSEQSAIWQCLEGQDKNNLRRIYLTASGGPLRRMNKKLFKSITISKVLKHPRWKMGKKITVDSATLMNKGLEVLEAMSLFGVSSDKVRTLVHPEAVIHSMVEFIDGVILAQLSVTDMRIPIQFALSYPDRLTNASGQWLDFVKLKSLNFEEPDLKKFPCLGLAYRVAKDLGTAPAVLNAANEVAVEEFLKSNISFDSIPGVIEEVLTRHKNVRDPNLGDILCADIWARSLSKAIVRGFN
jgi:1-deoxy-D-xylulose-5-phosphate reductoisomerase